MWKERSEFRTSGCSAVSFNIYKAVEICLEQKIIKHSLIFFIFCVGGWEVCAKGTVRGVSNWSLLVQVYLSQ